MKNLFTAKTLKYFEMRMKMKTNLDITDRTDIRTDMKNGENVITPAITNEYDLMRP